MKITKMVVNEKNKNLIDIYIDEQYYTNLDAMLVFNLNLKKDKELTLEILDSIQQNKQQTECFNKALVLVSKTLKTKKQLKDYLYQKGYNYDTIQHCLSKLEELHLIDDDNYCKKYIEQEKNKKGKLSIIKSLITKGIPKDLINKNIEAIETQKDTINSLINKYMKNKTHDLKNLQKLTRYLLGKGFSYEEIKSCIGEIDESWD